MELDTQLLRCGRCKVVFYCCQGHQKDDWEIHKKVCRPPVTSASSVKVEEDVLAPEEPSIDHTKATTEAAGEVRTCRCMFCGELNEYRSEEEAVDHMRTCPALQEQLDSPAQFHLPESMH